MFGAVKNDMKKIGESTVHSPQSTARLAKADITEKEDCRNEKEGVYFSH
jgi:hypothetical protein